jgi:hypothetical protein
MDQTHHANDGLTLAQSMFSQSTNWYVNADNINHAPGVSAATVELVDMNSTWYFHGIDGGHVVPTSGASISCHVSLSTGTQMVNGGNYGLDAAQYFTHPSPGRTAPNPRPRHSVDVGRRTSNRVRRIGCVCSH